MVRGASNTHKFYISIDQSQIAKVEAVYSQNGDIILTKTDKDMKYNSVFRPIRYFTLSQSRYSYASKRIFNYNSI